MTDREKVAKSLEKCERCECDDCIENGASHIPWDCPAYDDLIENAITLLKEQEKEIKALRLLVEWAEECGFGFDQFQNEYERYKDELKDMEYIDGMIHVAKRTLEDHEAFERGR